MNGDDRNNDRSAFALVKSSMSDDCGDFADSVRVESSIKGRARYVCVRPVK